MLRRAFIGGVSTAAVLVHSARSQPSGAIPPNLQLGPAASGATSPTLTVDFTAGADARLTTSRAAGGATYFDATNTLQLVSANTQRIDYGPTPNTVTNWIRNSTNVGAGAGTPGTLPTNWTRVDLVGITSQVVGTGVESGLPYVDIRWSGTAGAGGTVSLLTDTPTGVPTTVGTTWTSSLYVSLVGGSLSGMSGPIDNQVRFYNGAGAGLTGASGSFITPVTGSLLAQRTQFSRTATDATTGGTGQWIRMGITNGALVDMTLRFGGVQHETGAVANTFVPTSGSAASAGQATNWITNSLLGGGVPGSPGTTPTNHTISSSGTFGLTRTLGTLTTVNGITVLPVTWSGTANASGVLSHALTDTPSAAVGQIWTGSVYLQLVSGSFPHATTMEVDELSSPGGGFLAGSAPTVIVTGALTQFQSTRTFTTSTAGLARFQPMKIVIVSGDVVSVTYNIGAPQLEQAPSASAFIPTSGTIVTVGAVPKGLLIEEARTNSIRNPRVEGAVASDGVEQVTNGTFAANPINAAQSTVQNGWSWVATGTGTVVYSAGAVQLTGDGTNVTRIDTSITTIAGTTYILFFDVTGNTITVNAGNVQGGTGLVNSTSAIGTGQAVSFTATATTTWISFNKVPASTATVDNVSVKKAGVLPTNFGMGLPTGTVYTVVGTGSEAGVPFYDIRVSGVASTTSSTFTFETSTAIAALNAQIWTESIYVRLIAGSLTNITSMVLNLSMRDSGGALLADLTGTTFSPTASALAGQRISTTQTLNNASTAFVLPKLVQTVVAGAIDFTLRIGAPQLELGTFATSPILPAIGTPAATTRAADQVILNPFTPAANMTFEVEAQIPTLPPTGGAGNARILSADDGTPNNRITPVILTADTHVSMFESSSSVLAQTATTGVVTPGVAFKYACAVDGTVRTTLNGATPQSATNAVPIGINRVTFGYEAGLATQINGYVRKVNYWPRALTNVDLQAATI